MGAIGVLLVCSLMAGCFDKHPDEYLAAAKAALAKNDNAAALIQLKNALQGNPSLSEARVLLGDVLLQTGDARGALTELGKARELGATDERIAPLIARALLAQGEFAKAISEFADVTPSSKSALAELQAELAVAYSMAGNAGKAMALIESSVAADPESERAQLIRVRLVSAARGAEAGLNAVDAVLAKFPKSADGLQARGDLLGLQGKTEAALQAYRSAIALNKSHVLAHVGAFHMLLAKKDLDAAKAELEALRGMRGAANHVKLLSVLLALERNDLGAAWDSMQALLKVAADDVRVMHLAGVVAFRRGALLEAEDHLGKAVHASPTFDSARVLLAQAQLRSGDFSKALATLQPLIGEGGHDVDALSVAAEAYLQAGDALRAQSVLTRLSKLNPNDVASRVALAVMDISKGQVEQGVAALRALSAAHASPVPDLALVTNFMQSKNWDQALKSIETLERKEPDSAGPSNLRGRVELSRGNRDRAIEAFEAALKRDPAYYPAAATLALLDLEVKKPEAAVARFQKVLAVNPGSLSASMALIGLREQAGADKAELTTMLEKLIKQMPGEARPRLALIQLHLRRQQVKEALSVATEAAAALPGDPSVLRHVAEAQAKAGDYNQAINSFNKLIALQPKAPEPWMLLAQVYAARGDKKASTQAMERALKLRPGYKPAQRALIANELVAGNLGDANRLADATKAMYPDDPLAHSMAGDVAAMQKNWAGAMMNYRAALKLLPQVDIAIKLHQVMIGAGKLPEARQFESEWLAAHPKDLKFLIYSADAALLLQNHELARERYAAVLKRQADNANALNNMAWLLNRSKDPNALEYAERATKLVPRNPDYMDTLAQILASEGQLDKAIAIQQKAVDLAPEQGAYRFHLAQYYVKAGRKAQARELLERLASLGGSFPQAAEVRKLMETL